MRINWFYRSVEFVAIMFLASLTAAADSFSTEAAAKLLPPEIGIFRAIGPVTAFEDRSRQLNNVSSAGKRDYRAASGERFSVTLVTTKSDSSAYASFVALTREQDPAGRRTASGDVGTRSRVLPNQVLFFKGSTYVAVTAAATGSRRELTPTALELARGLAASLDNSEGDVPVLVKHLPDWQNTEPLASYALDLERLRKILPNQPVIEAVSFEGGTEAVAAPYAGAQMVLVEFTTPQLATENDQRILERLQQLRNGGQPVPTAYRRVGNYSVFVLNAASEQAANQLIDQVKYEQVVQWLGDNPNWLKQAQKEYTETTLGVFVTVVKTSGLAAVLCFGVGGFIGALLFARRRAQQGSAEAYSDAGGMMRLNLDELSGQTNTSKLIGSGMSDKL